MSLQTEQPPKEVKEVIFYLEQNNSGGHYVKIAKVEKGHHIILKVTMSTSSSLSMKDLAAFLKEYFNYKHIIDTDEGYCPCCGPRWGDFIIQEGDYKFFSPGSYPEEFNESVLYKVDLTGVSDASITKFAQSNIYVPLPVEPSLVLVSGKKNILECLDLLQKYKDVLKAYVENEFFEEEYSMLDKIDAQIHEN